MSAMIAPPLSRTTTCRYRLLERQYNEVAFTDVRLSEYRGNRYAIGAARQYMNARAWHWHALRGADIRMDDDGMGFAAVGRDGARTILAEVRIQEIE